MAEREKKLQRLADIKAEISERYSYLTQINRDIEAATIAGGDAIRDLQSEIRVLEDEKARLMSYNFGLEQRIRENKATIANMGV